ncbi:MAG: hypothetical protein ACOY94_19725 [Bacillota bacterium]
MDVTAQFDQALAALRDMAKTLGGYFNHLLEQGFTRGEALAIVRDWHIQVLRTGTGSRPSGGNSAHGSEGELHAN